MHFTLVFIAVGIACPKDLPVFAHVSDTLTCYRITSL